MKTDINLAGQTRLEKKVSGRLFILSLVLFVVFFSLAAVLITYSLILKTKASSLEQEATSLRSKISSFSKQKETLLIISERLGAIRKVMTSRKKIDNRVSQVVSVVPNSFGLESIKADDKLISITLSSPKLSDFDSFLEGKITSFLKDKTLNIAKINVSSFSQQKSQYILALDFYFTDTKKRSNL